MCPYSETKSIHAATPGTQQRANRCPIYYSIRQQGLTVGLRPRGTMKTRCMEKFHMFIWICSLLLPCYLDDKETVEEKDSACYTPIPTHLFHISLSIIQPTNVMCNCIYNNIHWLWGEWVWGWRLNGLQNTSDRTTVVPLLVATLTRGHPL